MYLFGVKVMFSTIMFLILFVTVSIMIVLPLAAILFSNLVYLLTGDEDFRLNYKELHDRFKETLLGFLLYKLLGVIDYLIKGILKILS